MKNSEKKSYSSVCLDILSAEREDVIATSAFRGEDHVIGGSTGSSYEI